MTTHHTRSGPPFDDLLFCIAYAISRSAVVPKTYRKMDITEPLARDIIAHLQRCNYVLTKGPGVTPHGSFMPDPPQQ